jgi:hypothetical protein
MRSILTFTLLIACFCSFAQVEFRLYGYSPCLKEVRRIDFFGLEKNDVTISAKDTAGVLLLKDTGIYVLSYALERIDSTQLGKKYHIKSFGNFSDTLHLLSIEPCLEPISHPRFIGYCCCDKKCEGAIVDYYKNGNKRIEGFFKSGTPIGRLKFYHPNGKLSMIKKYSKKGRLVKTYKGEP